MTTPDDKTNRPNVYQMFVAHGGPGFWVRRTTWDASCARIVRVGALTGPPPYYGSPSVLMDVYSLNGKLKDAAAWLSTAGTYKTWRQVEAPDWADPEEIRPLDDPALDDALTKLDRRRNKLNAKPAVERKTLAVPYARKEEAKAIGAKWDPTERTWWIPADDAVATAKALKLGFLEGRSEN